MTSPSQSQDSALQHQDSSQIENPISNLGETNQQNDHQSPETLEISRNQDPERSDPNLEETQVVLDQEEQEEEFSGNVFTTTSKMRNHRRQVYKRKRPGVLKRQQTIDKKVQNLLGFVNFVRFEPSKTLDFDKYEDLLKGLGLWDFVGIEFDDTVKANLMGQFIVSYDSTKKCCYVNGSRISINRTSFARALKLPMPIKKEKGVGTAAEAAIDLDLVWERVSDDCVAFVEDFVWSWVILHGNDWVMPNEIKGWLGFFKDGHPEKVDWASLFWVMVENELKQKDQLRTCYYTSHLQYYLKSHRKELFEEEGEKVVANEGIMGEGKLLSEEDNKQVEVEEIKKDGDLLEELHKVDEEVAEDGDFLSERPHEVENLEMVEKVKEGPDGVVVEKVKEDADGSFCGLSKEEDVVSEELNIELTLGQQDIVEKEKINDVSMMDVEECKEKKQDGWCFAGNDHGRKPFLRPCILGKGRGSDENEEGIQEVEQLEIKEGEQMEEVLHIQEGEQMEEVLRIQEGEQMEEVLHMQEGEQMEEVLRRQEGEQMEEVQHIQDGEQMEVVQCIQEGEQMEELQCIQKGEQTENVEQIQDWENIEAEEVEEDVDVDVDVDEVELDEMEQFDVEDEEDEDEELEDEIEHSIPPNYGSPEGADLQGDLLQAFETAQLASNLQGQQLHENSSMELFASNADTHLMMGGPSMYGNGHKRAIDYEQDTPHLSESKRIRTDVGWDQKTSDFGFCMSQAAQFMEKAKIMYDEKEQAFNQVNMSQQYLYRELQQRDIYIENLERNKNEEIQKKDAEIYRLERELGLFGELVNGYREALKENKRAFLEYRQRGQLPEEPIYKDAGPGGLVLSISELEKQRQQQENEDRLNRLMIEQKCNEALEGYSNQFEVLLSKVQMIDMNRLAPIEYEVKLLKELYAAKRRASEKEDVVPTDVILPSA